MGVAYEEVAGLVIDVFEGIGLAYEEAAELVIHAFEGIGLACDGKRGGSLYAGCPEGPGDEADIGGRTGVLGPAGEIGNRRAGDAPPPNLEINAANGEDA